MEEPMIDDTQNQNPSPYSQDEDLQSFVLTLERKIQKIKDARESVERRWVQDSLQLNGLYSDEVKQHLDGKNRSGLFLNLTRPKTNFAKARMYDLLFPSDDRNWGMSSTPVPTGQYLDGAAGIKEEAEKRAKLMQSEIEDQLSEGDYNIVCRDVIDDSIELGTGILKAPSITGNYKDSWEPSEEGHQLNKTEDPTPTPQRVDPWNYFVNMDATCNSEISEEYERHYFTRRDLVSLAKAGVDGFDVDAIIEIAKAPPKHTSLRSQHKDTLRAMNGQSQTLSDDDRYEVWEYHGAVRREDLQAAGVDVEEDYFDDISGIIWFCQGVLLKAVLNPMDAGGSPYSVLNWQEDITSIYGFGVPYQLRDPQAAANAAWRGINENGALTVRPNVVIDDQIIKPAVGNNWEVTAGKTWVKTDPAARIDQGFHFFNIPTQQQTLQSILDMAMKLADTETNLMIPLGQDQAPPLMSGSATGATIWQNTANIEIRRAVRNFDDNITIPVIKRYYHWNMQFNQKEEIKGDYRVSARGSSELLQKETQAQNLSQLLQLIHDPVLSPMMKPADLLRKTISSYQISPNEIVKTDEEIEQLQQAMSQQQPQPEPMTQLDSAKLEVQIAQHQAKLEQDNLNSERRLQEAIVGREIQMMRMAAEENVSIAKIQASLEATRKKTEAEEKKIAVDFAKFNDELSFKIESGRQGI